MFLDLDTGQPITTAVNDEDVDGTSPNAKFPTKVIDVSYATGRITFPSTVTARRVRIFYAGDQDWTVAVQKAPDTYVRDRTSRRRVRLCLLSLGKLPTLFTPGRLRLRV